MFVKNRMELLWAEIPELEWYDEDTDPELIEEWHAATYTRHALAAELKSGRPIHFTDEHGDESSIFVLNDRLQWYLHRDPKRPNIEDVPVEIWGRHL